MYSEQHILMMLLLSVENLTSENQPDIDFLTDRLCLSLWVGVVIGAPVGHLQGIDSSSYLHCMYLNYFSCTNGTKLTLVKCRLSLNADEL